MKTVELIGIPGSGKSTLTASLDEHLSERPSPSITLRASVPAALKHGVGDRLTDTLATLLPDRLLTRWSRPIFLRSAAWSESVIAFMNEWPRAYATMLSALARRADIEEQPDLVVRWFTHMAAMYQLAQSNLEEDRLFLVDEGFCQRSILVFGHRFAEADHDEVDRYLDSIPPPMALIHLDIDATVAARRLGDVGRLEAARHIDPDARVDFLSDAGACADHVAERARAKGWAVLTVDASRETADIVKTSLAFMEEQGLVS